MKKVLIAVVCLTLVLTLAFTLGALGKKPPPGKPEKPGKPEYVNYDVTLEWDVSTEDSIPCSGKHGVSTYDKPVRLILGEVFSEEITGCCLGDFRGSIPYGVYFQLWENKNKGTITMGYWFWYLVGTDKMEKLMLEVVEGTVTDGTWLSLDKAFTVEFTNASARITRTGNRVVWPENGDYGTVTIVVTCKP